MAADREYLRDVDLDAPVDEFASPPVAPEPLSTVTVTTTPAARPLGSSAAPNFSDLRTTFHDATRVPVDDLWQNGFDGAGKGSASLAPNTNDLAAAQNGLLAGINAGQFSGAALGHVQAILSDITTAISAANASVNGAGAPGAEQLLRASHLSILNTVNTDPALANPAPPQEAVEPAATPEATAPPADPAETDADNAAQGVEDPDAVEAAVQALMAENPDLFAGMTGEEVDAIIQQIQLELTHINDGDAPLVAAQESIDDVVAVVAAQGPSNILGGQDTQASPQIAIVAIDDVPVTIVTAEAPLIATDQSLSGEPEAASHLHLIWE